MTKRADIPDRTAEDAAGWFARLQGEDASGDDWLAFETWLNASPANLAAYERLEGLWAEIEARGPEVEAALDAAAPRRTAPQLSRRAWLGAAGGALAACAALAIAFNLPSGPVPAVTTVYESRPGEVKSIALEDGTHIRLNAGSRIAVTFAPDARRVSMSDAEATFDVAHDPKRPFLIAVGDREVRIVGTEFNLRRRGTKTTLTLRRGAVEVRPAAHPGAAPVRVAAGQQLTHHDGAAASTVAPVEPDEAFSWTAGQLVYRDAPLDEVAAELSRRFASPVRVADPETGRLRFTGVLMLDNKRAVLRRVEAFAPVRVETTAAGAVLHRR